MAYQPDVTSYTIPAAVPTAMYCNGVQVVTSEWDVTVLFFHSVPVPTAEGQTPASDRRLVQGVVMSPQHAKALASVLQSNVASWEERNGEINLPATFQTGQPLGAAPGSNGESAEEEPQEGQDSGNA